MSTIDNGDAAATFRFHPAEITKAQEAFCPVGALLYGNGQPVWKYNTAVTRVRLDAYFPDGSKWFAIYADRLDMRVDAIAAPEFEADLAAFGVDLAERIRVNIEPVTGTRMMVGPVGPHPDKALRNRLFHVRWPRNRDEPRLVTLLLLLREIKLAMATRAQARYGSALPDGSIPPLAA